MIATIWFMIAGCFSNYKSGVDPDGDGIPWPVDPDNTDTGAGVDCTRVVAELDYIEFDCGSIGYSYDVAYDGWGSAPDLYIYETGSGDPWNEKHPFPADPIEYDPYGCSEIYSMKLETVFVISDVVEGSTTLFDCDLFDKLSWLVYILNIEGDAIECGAWGEDVEEINEFFSANCPSI